MLDLEWILLYLLLGSFVGFMAGLLGVGGGGILVPLLVSLFNHQGIGSDNTIHMALATSLACMIVSASSSTRSHAARGAVLWPMVRGMAPGIVLGAALATTLAARIQATYIALFFVVFMVVVSVQMFKNWKPTPSLARTTAMGLFLAGSSIGSISALAAVGGGFLAIAYMTYRNVEIKKAIGTSAAIGLIIAISGSAGYVISGWPKTVGYTHSLGFIYLPAFVAISLASLVAAPYGARWAHSLSESFLRRIFAVVSLALSIKMLTNFSW